MRRRGRNRGRGTVNTGRRNDRGGRRDDRRDDRRGREPRQESRRRGGRRGRSDELEELFLYLNDLFADCIEDRLSSSRGIINNGTMERLNKFLFKRLSHVDDSRRAKKERKFIINPRDIDFALQLRVQKNERGRSRKTFVDRRDVTARQTPDLEEEMRLTASGLGDLDGVRNIIDSYVNTYHAIEQGIQDFITELNVEGYDKDDEVIRIINSGDIYYEYGGFRIMATIDGIDFTGWAPLYETTPYIKLSIKNDFGW